MFRSLLAIVAVLGFMPVFIFGFLSAGAAPQEVLTTAQPAAVIAAAGMPPSISAESFVVMDLETGTEVASVDAATVRPLASVSKLFSSAAFHDAVPLDSVVTITAEDVATYGVAGRFEAGDTIVARELLFPALLESSNDASAAQARVAPNDLIVSMNALARRYDAPDLIFEDPTGLSSNNQGSARSVAKLVQVFAHEYPQLIDITRLKKYSNHESTWVNNNPLIGLSGYRGGKHGWTPDAGKTVAALFEDTLANGERRTFLYVLLDSDDLVTDIEALRDYASQNVRYE